MGSGRTRSSNLLVGDDSGPHGEQDTITRDALQFFLLSVLSALYFFWPACLVLPSSERWVTAPSEPDKVCDVSFGFASMSSSCWRILQCCSTGHAALSAKKNRGSFPCGCVGVADLGKSGCLV